MLAGAEYERAGNCQRDSGFSRTELPSVLLFHPRVSNRGSNADLKRERPPRLEGDVSCCNYHNRRCPLEVEGHQEAAGPSVEGDRQVERQCAQVHFYSIDLGARFALWPLGSHRPWGMPPTPVPRALSTTATPAR